jgi:hypothetical protein
MNVNVKKDHLLQKCNTQWLFGSVSVWSFDLQSLVIPTKEESERL